MTQYLDTAVLIMAFTVIALASKEIGKFLVRYKMPLISGFLFAGIVVGPFGLNLIAEDKIPSLRFIDEVSLAFIAFAAGSELYLKSLRSRLRSITFVTAGLMIVTFFAGAAAVYLLAGYIPFLQTMSAAGRLAVSLLAGAILVARSPSSAIAIINELRAKGPFTMTVLGVTMISDIGVILLFAINSEIADALLTDINLSLGFVGLLLVELGVSIGLGVLLGKWVQFVLSQRARQNVKTAVILLSGYGIFLLSAAIRIVSHEAGSIEILLEPLLICMIAGFWVTNNGNYRQDFAKSLHDVSFPIYIIFFTLTGVALELDILAKTWLIALALFFVRLITIFIGSFAGGALAGEPGKHNRISWMAYLTQAGVGLGLAKEVAVEFPTWGEEFATIIISVIVLNQIVGPPFLKWAINRVGEAHTRAATPDFDGTRDALIFGLTPQSIQLARKLESHDWQARLVCVSMNKLESLDVGGVDLHKIKELTLPEMESVGLAQADALVSFLSDEESFQICELAYESYGTETMVVKLEHRKNFPKFHELGVLVIEPQTALVSLLEHFVRAPVGVSMLLGMDGDQDLVDVEMNNPDLEGITIRELSLPLEVLILSIHRDGHTIITRGYTDLRMGDRLTMVGPEERIEEIMVRFEA